MQYKLLALRLISKISDGIESLETKKVKHKFLQPCSKLSHLSLKSASPKKKILTKLITQSAKSGHSVD